MKIVLDGFGKFADTLHVHLPRRIPTKCFFDLLEIDSVVYVWVQGPSVGVRYKKTAEVVGVAAQVIATLAERIFEVSRYELDFEISDYFLKDDEVDMYHSAIMTELNEVQLPPEVSTGQVVARGTAPAYYLW